jgi:ketosteroid isomerase-like protein
MLLRRLAVTALLAACAILVPAAAAQAHHVDSKAECVLVADQPVLKLTAYFIGFSSTKSVNGKVLVDGVEKFNGAVPVTWGSGQNANNGTWVWTQPAVAGKSYVVKTAWSWNGGYDGEKHYTNKCPYPTPKPAIDLTKTGPAFAYAGDTVTYSFAVRNTGNVTLTLGAIADDKCASTPVRKAGETDTSFDPGDTFNFTCTYVVPAGVTSVLNKASVCGDYKPPSGPTQKVCDNDDHNFPVRSIAIDVDKNAVETTAVAGSTVHFTISVKNTGNTSYVEYVFDDPNCAEQRTGANASDPTLDPGETWTYSCAMATQAGQTRADNTAAATGKNSDGKSATDTDSASIPLTQPQTPLVPPQTPTTPEGEGGVLPETIVSGRARLRGPSGCVYQAFTARVRGRRIARVRFYVDGRLVKTINDRRRLYTAKIRPRGLGLGIHRVTARVRFVASSRTPARTLRLTFRRCARQTVAPRFTG